MKALPDFLERGEIARLIPVVKDSQREDRASSILLAGWMVVDDLAKFLVIELNVRLPAVVQQIDLFLFVFRVTVAAPQG